jgi:hypothetical protein
VNNTFNNALRPTVSGTVDKAVHDVGRSLDSALKSFGFGSMFGSKKKRAPQQPSGCVLFAAAAN